MQTKRLRSIHHGLAKDTSDQLAALRDAALNSDNSPDETRPACVFRFRNAVSDWLPHDCIATSLWLPDQDDIAAVAGGTDGRAHPIVDASFNNVCCSHGPDSGRADVGLASGISDDPASAAPQTDLQPSGCTQKHLIDAPLPHEQEHSPGHIDQDGEQELAVAIGQIRSDTVQTTMVSKPPAGLPPELQVSKDDESILKAAEKNVSKFSASCTLEPWLSKHCSMFGFDVVKEAVKQRIKALRHHAP